MKSNRLQDHEKKVFVLSRQINALNLESCIREMRSEMAAVVPRRFDRATLKATYDLFEALEYVQHRFQILTETLAATTLQISPIETLPYECSPI